ncbi:hypothetical protein IMCC14465_09190 [alpha proteobacterium IMCC14465]|uniref:Uncharacterized protein n=1 Tax=alpha proteobacterium IMCC14465 TaxID=1220535 RepID=J9DG83_9PROT|nr:hypothetical protein IMCC14465_09190 [alpha proteobacterium IMCC14465]
MKTLNPRHAWLKRLMQISTCCVTGYFPHYSALLFLAASYSSSGVNQIGDE